VANSVNTGRVIIESTLTGTNYIYHNNFTDFQWNKTVTTNSPNVWSNNGQGNFWSNYNGNDKNADGIGDTPYVIDTTNVDNFPLMAPINITLERIPSINK
jgi:nitrous oxidase accessory protein NosD